MSFQWASNPCKLDATNGQYEPFLVLSKIQETGSIAPHCTPKKCFSKGIPCTSGKSMLVNCYVLYIHISYCYISMKTSRKHLFACKDSWKRDDSVKEKELFDSILKHRPDLHAAVLQREDNEGAKIKKQKQLERDIESFLVYLQGDKIVRK